MPDLLQSCFAVWSTSTTTTLHRSRGRGACEAPEFLGRDCSIAGCFAKFARRWMGSRLLLEYVTSPLSKSSPASWDEAVEGHDSPPPDAGGGL